MTDAGSWQQIISLAPQHIVLPEQAECRLFGYGIKNRLGQILLTRGLELSLDTGKLMTCLPHCLGTAPLSRNCIIHTTENKQVVVQGLDGYIVAEKDGRLLICKLSEEQRIKQFSGQN